MREIRIDDVVEMPYGDEIALRFKDIAFISAPSECSVYITKAEAGIMMAHLSNVLQDHELKVKL
jgi:hypothetical protein